MGFGEVVGGGGGGADRDAQADRLEGRFRIDRGLEAVDDELRGGLVGVVQEDGELVAADTGHEIRVACGALDEDGGAPQELVAEVVAVAFVCVLEATAVDLDDADRLARGDMVGESLVPREPVCNLREGILARLPRGLDEVLAQGVPGESCREQWACSLDEPQAERLAEQREAAWRNDRVRRSNTALWGSWSPSR